MEGKFNLSLLDASKLKDSDFNLAILEGRIDQFLRGLRVADRCSGISNMLFDNLVAVWYYNLFSGGDITNPYDSSTTEAAALGSILLTTHTNEPTYTEASSQQTTMHNLSGTVNSSNAGKRFIQDQLTHFKAFAEPSKREAIVFRNRWLYAPSEAISADIKSVAVYWRSNADAAGTNSQYHGIIARVRLKDDVGTPITWEKTGSQALLVEYTLTLVSS